jgi:hypothetical protein
MNGIRVPGNPVSTCSGRTGRARRCLDHPWPSPAIAPPALPAYRQAYPFVVSPQNPFVVSPQNRLQWLLRGRHHQPSMAIAGNCSCIAGIPAIRRCLDHAAWHTVHPWHRCSCVVGIPSIHGHRRQLLLHCRHTDHPWMESAWHGCHAFHGHRRQLLLHCRHTDHPWMESAWHGCHAFHGHRRQLLLHCRHTDHPWHRRQLLLRCRHTVHPWT